MNNNNLDLINELQNKGFKQIAISKNRFINKNGVIYNIEKLRYEKPYKHKKNGVLFCCYLNKRIAEILLDTFLNGNDFKNIFFQQRIYIDYVDFKTNNINIDNIFYCSQKEYIFRRKNKDKIIENITIQQIFKNNKNE